MQKNIYQYYCITEQKYINDSINVDDPTPTVCKNGSSHEVDWDTLSIDYASVTDGINHGTLDNLTDDDHPQYLNINGRSGGQTIYGGTGPQDNLTFKSTSDNTTGRMILDDKTTVNNIYPTLASLSVQSNSNMTNVEILNNGGPEKGGVISIKDANLEIHNNQEGDIKLYFDGTNKFTMQKDGVFRIHNLEPGFLKSNSQGHIMSIMEKTAFNKDFGNTQGSVAEGNHTHLASSITMGTFDNQRISQSSVTQHESSINHDNLADYISSEHVDHTRVSIVAGEGLSGGGTIESSRTLSLDINSLETNSDPDGSIDYVMTYNVADGSHKKILINNLPISNSTWSRNLDDIHRSNGKVVVGSNSSNDARVKITGFGNNNPWLHLEGGPGQDDGQIIFHKGPTITLQNYDDPSRIEFVQIGSGNTETPEHKTWFGMSNSLSTDMQLMGGKLGIGKRPTVALDVLGDVTISGLLNGRNIVTDGSKLDSHVILTTNVHGVVSQLVGTTDAQTLTNKTIDATHNTITGVISTSKVIDTYYNGDKDISFAGTWTDLPLEINRNMDDYYAHLEGSSEITINMTHRYKIESRCTTMLTNKSNSQSMSTLFVNNGSGYDEIDGSSAYMYNKKGAQSYNTGSVTVIIDLMAGDKIKMMAIRISGNGTVSFVPDACSMTIMTI